MSFQKLMRDADRSAGVGRNSVVVPELHDTSALFDEFSERIQLDEPEIKALRSSVRRIPTSLIRRSSVRATYYIPSAAAKATTAAQTPSTQRSIFDVAWEEEVNEAMRISSSRSCSSEDSDGEDGHLKKTSTVREAPSRPPTTFHSCYRFQYDIAPHSCFDPDYVDVTQGEDPLDRLFLPEADAGSDAETQFSDSSADDELLHETEAYASGEARRILPRVSAQTCREETMGASDKEAMSIPWTQPATASFVPPVSHSAPNADRDKEREEREKEKEREQDAAIQLALEKEQRIKDKIQRIRSAGMGFDAAASIEHSIIAKRPRDNNNPQQRSRGRTQISALSHSQVASTHKNSKPDLFEIELKFFHRPRMIRDRDRPWQISTAQPTKNPSSGALLGRIVYSELEKQNLSLAGNSCSFLVLEYVEEFPPIVMNYGMGSVMLNYYRSSDETEENEERRIRAKHDTDRLLQSLGDGGTGLDVSSALRCRLPRHLVLLLQQRSNPKQPYEHDVSVPRLSLGETKVLTVDDDSPFLGNIEKEEIQPSIVNNLFRAPVFRHSPHPTDFLLIRTKISNKVMHYNLREIPYLFLCGQLEPQKIVPRPVPRITQLQEKFYLLIAARYLHTKFDEGAEYGDLERTILKYCLKEKTAPHKVQHRQKLRNVLRLLAEEIKDASGTRWFVKEFERFHHNPLEAAEMERKYSPEELAASFTPEEVCLQESANAAEYRLFQEHVTDVELGRVETWLNRMLRVKMTRMQRAERIKRLQGERDLNPRDAEGLQRLFKILAKDIQRLEAKMAVARFVFDRLVVAPWNTTEAFVRSHLEQDGLGRMELLGKGDPSGRGEAFSFVRLPRRSTTVSTPAGETRKKVPVKLFNTDRDLRKLTKIDAIKLLVAAGMRPVEAQMLRRWDRVHIVQEMSTKLQRSGLAKELHKYARGEGFKPTTSGGGGAEESFRNTCQEIWNRQKMALGNAFVPTHESAKRKKKLAVSALEAAGGDGTAMEVEEKSGEAKEKEDGDEENSDSDSEDDYDIEKALTARAAVDDGIKRRGRDDTDSKAAEKEIQRREQQELRALGMMLGGDDSVGGAQTARRRINTLITSGDSRGVYSMDNSGEGSVQPPVVAGSSNGSGSRSVRLREEVLSRYSPLRYEEWNRPSRVVKRVTRLIDQHGNETLRVQFILSPSELKRVESVAAQERQRRELRRNGLIEAYVGGESAEAEGSRLTGRDGIDDLEDATTTAAMSASGPRTMSIKLGRMKKAVDLSQEQLPKRETKKESLLEPANAKSTKVSKRSTILGSINLRVPRISLAARFEREIMEIWRNKLAPPFHYPVDESYARGYYSLIQRPICLSDIRAKIANYQYDSAAGLLADLELMVSNCVAYNGLQSPISANANKLLDKLKTALDHERKHLGSEKDSVRILEDAIRKRQVGKSGFIAGNVGAGRGEGATSTENFASNLLLPVKAERKKGERKAGIGRKRAVKATSSFPNDEALDAVLNTQVVRRPKKKLAAQKNTTNSALQIDEGSNRMLDGIGSDLPAFLNQDESWMSLIGESKESFSGGGEGGRDTHEDDRLEFE